MTKTDILGSIREALKTAPPPPESEEVTGRKVAVEMYDDIQALKTAGHTFESIAEIISKAGYQISGSTLTAYFRDERKARKREANRLKREARQKERETQLSSDGEATAKTTKLTAAKAIPKATVPQRKPQTMTATLEPSDDEIQ